MSFGFPAYAEATEAFDADWPELIGAIEATLNTLGWDFSRPSRARFVARVSVSSWSWGERITIVVDEFRVRIRSECVYPLQFIDWGKNRRNVDTLINRLQAKIGRQHS